MSSELYNKIITTLKNTNELLESKKCIDCDSFSYRDSGRKKENYGFCPPKDQWVTDNTRCSTVKDLKKGEQEK